MAYAEEKPQSLSEDEESDLLEQFKSDLGESTAYMKPIQHRMDKDYEAYRNYRSNLDDFNFKVSDFFEYVETVVPIVTNNRIRASVHSDYPEYVIHAKGINDILDHTYDVNNWDYQSQEIFRQSLIYRSGFVYTGFDKEYKNGTGRLCIDQVNTRWVWLDPNPTQFEDSRYLFVATPMRKTQVFKMYPEMKKKIQESIIRNMPTNTPSNGVNTQDNGGAAGWFKTWLGTVKNFLAFNGNVTQAKVATNPYLFSQQEISEQAKHKNVIAYIEYWYRDDDDEWRKSCWADDCLLSDEPNPFWHGQLPYDILSPVKDPLSMLGVPMSEQIDTVTLNRNLMMNYVLANAKLHANPPLLFNTAFGNVKDPQKLKEMADEGVIPVTNFDNIPLNAVADYMSVPVLPGYATGIFDQLGQIKDALTGVNDSFRGTQQASSGKEVQLQQEAAYTRIKTMIDQFELTNKKIAEKVIINAMQFYTQQRGFRIKGDYRKYDASQEQGKMPFEIEKIKTGTDTETQEPTFDRTEFFLYANPNEWTKLDSEGAADDEGENAEESQDNQEVSTETDDGTAYVKGPRKESRQATDEQADTVEKAYKVLQFTVEIEAGSSLPQSRLARREEANELFTAGAIDQQSLLDTYDWPDREEIIKRMNEKAMAAQQAQAQAAQAEAQAKVQVEKQKMALEEKKLQAQVQQTHMNNQAKVEQQQVQNRGDVATQGVENSGEGLAETLDQIRQINPQAQNLSDEELIQALQGV